jgi:hypothetical protein
MSYQEFKEYQVSMVSFFKIVQLKIYSHLLFSLEIRRVSHARKIKDSKIWQ